MSTTDTDPNTTHVDEAPTPEASTLPTVLPSSVESGQTTENTGGSNNTNSASANLPVGPASNVGSSQAASQILLNRVDGHRINRDSLDLDAIEKNARLTGTYTGALLMSAAVVPSVAAAISAIAFIGQWPKGLALPDWLAPFVGTPLLLGAVSTHIAWLLLALFLRRFTAVDCANMGSFGLLLNRLSTLDAQLSILCPDPEGTPTESGANAASALSPTAVAALMASEEALDSRNAICKKLVKKSLMWVTAIGYIDLWKELYSAEEALIDMMPSEVVIADALSDKMRIQDSKIETSDELLRKLRKAVMTLNPSAQDYLQSSTTNQQGESSAGGISAGKDPAAAETQARSVLREVRHTLNEFRDDRWEAIVRVRNQFVCTTILTGITMYVLFVFSIIAGASQPAIISATAFYLVGAPVGLFNRLYSESQTSKSIDDYRLAVSRLVAIPMFCGLAAVGGVLITQKFTTLVDIYDPKDILSGLVVAAVFALTPNLLISTLQKQTEQYKTDLKSTATQGQDVKTPLEEKDTHILNALLNLYVAIKSKQIFLEQSRMLLTSVADVIELFYDREMNVL